MHYIKSLLFRIFYFFCTLNVVVDGKKQTRYDFSVFGFLAKQISVNFFPKGEASVQLLATYGVFAGAFVARPLGGIVFGVIGDKYGRKQALQLSMLVMFVATLIMGCLPTYHTIGIGAPVLLTILRLIQGFSVGGQLVGSMLFLVGLEPHLFYFVIIIIYKL
ncbi:major facilitator superfamily protein [Reticulomyxa filosa]|uniref:Major facilitator superfamily protein n=1 Tax=Reticulomyxa filosa TaxID=46433 RepID=X6P4E6_RETFI|nr:major facilitator superfamily protein [Reticulomyxa filosa]|eukprot:ETO33091.1 major facilitator superfamily protein [Reticulomyxa filosa]